MPLVDRWAGATHSSGTDVTPEWFDDDEDTYATVLIGFHTVFDAGAVVNVDYIRLSWSYGDLVPGQGAAGSLGIDRGDTATGPWTEILTDAWPPTTAGVTYPDDFEYTYDLGGTESARWWRFRSTGGGNNDIKTANGYEDVPDDPDEPPVDPGYTPPDPGLAILEIYVHDEDASRWGTATWATGPATGTEGIWSAAGWQDITPQGVNAHIMWGSRRPDRGILAEQDGATWNVETYDPDRVLDPANDASPYWPQLVSGVPIRISHASSGIVLRTGYIDRLRYKHKAPAYRGEIQATDSVAMLHLAEVPEDSILGNTLLERIQDAIDASGIAVGGLPIRPIAIAGESGNGPALSDQIDGKATVWQHIRRAAQEVLYVPFIEPDGALGIRAWGTPLDRGTELTYTNLEDLETAISEDGVYSVVYVTNADGSAVIERVAAPLPRYGRRPYTRSETTEDPEAWADAVLAERAWPGVQYIPGVIHCFTAQDVDDFGTLQIMERLTLTVPGVVSVQGRVLGMELWVSQRKDSPDGATWLFLPKLVTDGSTAIGTTVLVSDQSGEYLVDDDLGTEYLEAD